SVVGNLIRIGAVEPAVRLGEVDVVLARQTAAHEITRPLRQKLVQLPVAKLEAARLADPRRNVAEQRLDQRAQVRLDLTISEVGAHEPDAAVDIVPDSARR